MNKTILAGAFACAVSLTPAFANEVEEACKTYAAEHGGDATGCACLGEMAAGDADLAAAIMEITDPAALEAADEATKEAIGACFPEA